MYNIEEIYSQSLSDEFSIQVEKPLGFSVINYGVKIQKPIIILFSGTI